MNAWTAAARRQVFTLRTRKYTVGAQFTRLNNLIKLREKDSRFERGNATWLNAKEEKQKHIKIRRGLSAFRRSFRNCSDYHKRCWQAPVPNLSWFVQKISEYPYERWGNPQETVLGVYQGLLWFHEMSLWVIQQGQNDVGTAIPYTWLSSWVGGRGDAGLTLAPFLIPS